MFIQFLVIHLLLDKTLYFLHAWTAHEDFCGGVAVDGGHGETDTVEGDGGAAGDPLARVVLVAAGGGGSRRPASWHRTLPEQEKP